VKVSPVLRREHPGLLSIHRLVKFGTIGVVNTGVYYALYVLLHMAVPYLVAHTVAFALAMVGSYFLNCWVTFRIRPSWRTFLLFPLSNLTNFVITTIGLQVAVAILHWSALWAPLPVAVIAVPFTYIVAHYVMLGRTHKHSGEHVGEDQVASAN
jgi:putative flippase GtrA